jgi:hypothetical protein
LDRRFVYALAVAPLLCIPVAVAQVVTPVMPKLPPHPHAGVKGITEPDEPEHPTPSATDFHDAKYRLAFHVPAGWNFERKDGVLSNFGVDVRTTNRQLDVRGVASLNYNPYPVSTFSGANFYYSVMPRTTAAACAAQATTGHLKPRPDISVAGITFKHGKDEHGAVCTESRDEVFTAMQGKSCLRFDLVVNTFCAETSGAMEISAHQLSDVDTRLANILGSIKIDH